MDKTKHIVIDARIRRSSTGRYADRLIEHLQKFDKKNKYTVLLAPGDAWSPTRRNFSTAVCRYKQFSFNPLEQFGFAWQLYRLKPDLVHFTMTQQPVLYFGKNVTTTHDLTMLRYSKPGRLPKWLHRVRMRAYRFLLWQSHRKAKIILVPSEYVGIEVKKHHLFVGRKIRVTLEASEPPVAEKAKSPEVLKPYLQSTNYELRFLLYVGSAFPHKNLKRLIKGFQTVREKQPDLQLVLAGKREQHSNRLEKWAEKNDLSENVIFTGFVSEPELKWLYENALAYVFPSLSEGFGLPGLEAMAHDCPVVSSDATCLPEIYGDAAHYFNPKSEHDIADAIKKVINNEKFRKDLIKKGRKQVNKYSWQKMAAQTLQTYEEALQ
ncbi:glycosyltransferase family 4 protein [Candidatus Parcubacteria bacterium]|nr:glycosyltransferase family 4 protein [Candidatus Parcubacteria bacterium]